MAKNIAAVLLAAWGAAGVTLADDMVLFNGRIVTVNESFDVVEALAISGDRIVAAGTRTDVEGAVAADAARIDLEGRTVIPGLIDNHVHAVRGSRQWHRDARLDGITRRTDALDHIAARAGDLGADEWVIVSGGFTPNQFLDDSAPFTRAELDSAAPDNPVLVQVLFGLGYANSRAFEEIEIFEDTDIEWLTIANDIDLDAQSRPTGTVRAAALARMQAKVAEPDAAEARARIEQLAADYNRVGLTSVLDASGSEMPIEYYRAFRDLDGEGRLNLRLFHLYTPVSYQPGDTATFAAELDSLPRFEDSEHLQRVGLGERLYSPVHDSMQLPAASAPEHLQAFSDLARQAAEGGWHLHQHATHIGSIRQHLDVFEAIDAKTPLAGLRWTFAHADGIDREAMDRARALGMMVATHSRRVISGSRFAHPLPLLAFGNPPLADLQASGIRWGLGTDTNVVNQYNPFVTLWWAVTGRALNGDKLTDQTVTREQALVAHTRSNAWFVFREDDLGSLEPGKFADLVVLDRDYLTIPEDEIRRIGALATMVGGRWVHSEL